jgi:DNA-binding MarR family transcriptional regulator
MPKSSDDPSSGPEPHGLAGIPPVRYDQHILRSLRRIIRAMDIHSQRLRLTHEITGPQLVCLAAIVTEGPISIKQIAESVSLSPSTVVGVLDRLESKGLIMGLRDLQDRRVVNVSATPTGVAMVGQGPSPLHDGLARALNSLSDIEQATIALSLERIVNLMEERQLAENPSPQPPTGDKPADS